MPTESNPKTIEDTLEKMLYAMHGIEKGDVPFVDRAIAQALADLSTIVRDARIDELSHFSTRRAYGKDYQDTLDSLDEYKDARITELEKENI